MPCYDYRCKKCETTFEVTHSMTEKPVVVCPSCQSKDVVKEIPLVGISTHFGKNNLMSRAVDQSKRNLDMKEEMRREMGIEKIHPLGRSSMKQIYDDAKAQKTQIKEEMAQTSEQRAKETAIKQREWKKEALKRTPERAKIRTEMRAKEAAAKRTIRI